nr:hypothetical protein [Gemmatimonadota bacterium]
SDDDDEGSELGGDDGEEDPSIEKSLAAFDRLFAILTEADRSAREVLIAFDLSQYVCDRLRPEPARARAWLNRLIKVLLEAGVTAERRDDVAAAALTILGASPGEQLCRSTRSILLELGVVITEAAPPHEKAGGFQSVLPQLATFEQLWAALRMVRTYQEQLQSYREALEIGTESEGYPDLPNIAPLEWPTLRDAFTSKPARRRLHFAVGEVDVCPVCDIAFSSGEAGKLRSIGIATSTQCCRRIVISVPA